MDYKGGKHYKMLLTALFILCALPIIIDCKSIGLADKNVNSIDVQVSYFKRYGYLQNNFDLSKFKTGYSKEAQQLFEQAVREFQAMMGIPVTGILDKDSLNVMSMPRCGMPDKQINDGNSRQKRYSTFNGLRLNSHNISYGVEPNSYTTDLSRTKTKQILRKALQMWSDIANLNFYEDKNPVIEFRFARLSHNDEYDFDGPGDILAHSFPPIYSNFYTDYLADAHFDDDELWTDGSYTGRNLFQVATHELGHSFGLNHTSEMSAVMAPVYRGYNPYFAMHQDDIDGIQYLYGPPRVQAVQTPAPTPAPTPPPTLAPGIAQQQPRQQNPTAPNACAYNYCSCAEVHAVSTTQDRSMIFAFNDKYVYKLDPWAGVLAGYPKPTGEVFPRFSGKVDAALTWPKAEFKDAPVTRLFLFQDYMVYIYYLHDNGTVDFYDKGKIKDRFPGISGPVNVSLVWSGNGMTYFISGRNYYRLTTNGDGRVHEDYPRNIHAWGFPNNQIPDSGFQYYNSYTYFFFGTQYYRYNDELIEVVKQSYPRNNAIWWFGCNAANLVDATYSHRWQHEPLNKLEVEKQDRTALRSDFQANSSSVPYHGVTYILSAILSIIIGVFLL